MKRKRKSKGRRLPWRAYRPKPYAEARAIHAYENEVILRKMAEVYEQHGLTMLSYKQLCGYYPDLFNAKNLQRALRRMGREGIVHRSGRRNRWFGMQYGSRTVKALVEAKAKLKDDIEGAA